MLMDKNTAFEMDQPEKRDGHLRRLIGAKFVRCSVPPGLRFGGAMLQFFATVLIARTLGEGRSGEFFFWSAVLMSFGQVATFGMDKLALREIPRLDGNVRAQASFLAPVRGIAIILALMIGFLFALYALVMQAEIERSIAWFALLPACLVGVALCRINGEAMKGMGRPVLGVLYRHVAATSVYVLMLLIFGSILNPEIALACLTAGFLVVGIGALRGPGFSGLSPSLRLPHRDDFRSKILLGLPICASAAFTSFAFIVPLAILERWHDSSDVAYLTTSYRMFMLFEVLGLAVYSISMPQLSRSAHAADWHLTGRVYRGSIHHGLMILGLPVMVAIIFAEPLMTLFGDGFVDAAPVLRMLLVFRLISLLFGPAEDLILMVGHTGKLASFACARLGATVLAAPFVVPAFGPIGMAAIIGIGLLLQKSLCLWHFKKISAGRADGRRGS
ncbi:MAG: O-antigen/teichoic acid export membrane protein [Verrucomicrobiales bacterium]|jgi:O-antigen/teichoic acid export membrane protein